MVVDCGSIPPTLAEATLFGHERGAFTGAVDKRLSPFVEADGGTIFLDELGELPLDVQPKLLRALAERRIKAVGGSNYREVDVRVLAATRRDLVRAVNSGGFRSDLYFRIAQVKIELPSLRHRMEDIPILVRRMLKDLGDEAAYERITNATLERLMRHDWPGNVRELRNAVAVAFALAARRRRSTSRPPRRAHRDADALVAARRAAAPATVQGRRSSRTRSATCSPASSATTSPRSATRRRATSARWPAAPGWSAPRARVPAAPRDQRQARIPAKVRIEGGIGGRCKARGVSHRGLRTSEHPRSKSDSKRGWMP